MQELRDQGVQRVAWINLSERRSGYRDTNRALTAASLRWPELRVLDWRSYSAGRGSWFIDGVHLTATGRARLRPLPSAIAGPHGLIGRGFHRAPS
jgi:hypothetical protein